MFFEITHKGCSKPYNVEQRRTDFCHCCCQVLVYIDYWAEPNGMVTKQDLKNVFPTQ